MAALDEDVYDREYMSCYRSTLLCKVLSQQELRYKQSVHEHNRDAVHSAYMAT
jgi:hypothetical protein